MIRYAKLVIDNKEFTYQIRFSTKAKYLQLRITQFNQLEVVIPKRYSIKDGEKLIHDRIDWVKKYHKQLILAQKKEFFLFGNKIHIEQSFNLFLKKHRIRFSKNVLYLESPADTKITIGELYNLFLRNSAKKYFIERARFLAEKFHFNYKTIRIRGQSTRWGSCSSRGNLSFNYKLLRFKKEVIDYVIIHELCHTKEMNHSKRFWNLVEKYCPDFRSFKNELKTN
jgi:predicted metal-dependent hydrolase